MNMFNDDFLLQLDYFVKKILTFVAKGEFMPLPFLDTLVNLILMENSTFN